MLEVRDVSKTFTTPGSSGWYIKALEGINLQVKKGEFVSVIGPSGCGKSTLLAIISGFITDYEGEVYVKEERVARPISSIGVVFQEESTFPWRTTMGNVEFGLEMHGVPKRERRRKCQEIIDLVGLTGFEDRYPSELSGGMKQRVAMARTLVMEPEIILMDEPFGALDEQTRFILGEELLRIRDKLGQTILFITHNINEAIQLSERVLVMTARPGTIKREFNIDLPYPRDSSVITSERFGRVIGQVLATLQEESLKGFRQQQTERR